MIDEPLQQEINQLVAEYGHNMLKKKEKGLRIKTDSYVLETNVHFSTDLNLLWDSLRKGLDTVENLMELSQLYITVEKCTILRLKSVPLYSKLTRHFATNKMTQIHARSGNKSPDYIIIL